MTRKSFPLLAATLVLICVAATRADAEPVTLTFDDLAPGASVLNFYNGGFGSSGGGPGPNYGVTFSTNATVFAGSGGNRGFFFSPPGPAVMNVAGGFVSQLQFAAFTGTPFPAGTVSVYEGANGTGALLAQTSPLTASPTYSYLSYSLSLNGLGRSIVFGGLAGFAGYDSITITPASSAPIPEPTTALLLGTGLAGVTIKRRRRKAKTGRRRR